MNSDDILTELKKIQAQFRPRTFVMSEAAFDKLLASAGIPVPIDADGNPVRRLRVGWDLYAASYYLDGDQAYEINIDMAKIERGGQ